MPYFSNSPSFRKSRMSRAQSFPDNRQDFSGMSLVQRLFDPDIFCSWLAALPACWDCINRRTGDMLMEKLWNYLSPLPKNPLSEKNSVIRSYIFLKELHFCLCFSCQTVRIRSMTKQAKVGPTPGATMSPCSTRTTTRVSCSQTSHSRLEQKGEAMATSTQVWLLFGEPGSALVLAISAKVDFTVHDSTFSWKPIVVVRNSLFTL